MSAPVLSDVTYSAWSDLLLTLIAGRKPSKELCKLGLAHYQHVCKHVEEMFREDAAPTAALRMQYYLLTELLLAWDALATAAGEKADLIRQELCVMSVAVQGSCEIKFSLTSYPDPPVIQWGDARDSYRRMDEAVKHAINYSGS